eukprot:m.109806 g.109806  ORF g.109806 m.109806 type:complete len:208 (+) comp27988_c0_seq1:92-715(+)
MMQTMVLGGLDLSAVGRTTTSLIHNLRSILRVYYRTILGHTGFRLHFAGVSSLEGSPVLIRDARKFRRDGDTSALDTYFDTEIVYEVHLDPNQNPQEGLVLISNQSNSRLLELFQDSQFFESFVMSDRKLTVIVEGQQCEVEPCASSACESVSNGCLSRVPCGDCGLQPDCAMNFYACINDGDCSGLRHSTDGEGTMDHCLLDTSQL